MNPEFDEVLLTAYLDDEVTDAERASVEEQLQKSEAARKLLRELRSIRSMVTQLHLSQASRDWQKGPWNATPESTSETRDESSGDSAVEVLPASIPSASSLKWRLTLQRLASLAALIAVVVCSAVLMTDSSKKPISRADPPTDGPAPEAAIAMKMESSNAANEPASKMDSARSMASDSTSVDVGAPSQPAPPAPAASARGGVGGTAGLDGASMPKIAFEKSESGEDRLTIENTSLNRQATALKLQADGKTEKQDLALSLWVKSYFEESDSKKSGTVALDQFVPADALSAGEKVESFQFGQLGNKDSSSHYFSWRYQPNSEPIEVDSIPTTELLGRAEEIKETFDLRAGGASADPQDKQLAMKKKSLGSKSLVLEFQIPSKDWAAGANRLRQLGVDVPLELPNEDLLEFASKKLEPALRVVASSRAMLPADSPVNQPVRSKRIVRVLIRVDE